MDNYSPPFSISNRMLELVSSISEKIGQLNVSPLLDSRPHLRRNNRIKSIHSSLKIEANSLSLSQVRDVIDGHLVIGDQKEIQEVKNAYKAYEEITTINPYSIDDLKRIHGLMTYRTIEESGCFRKGEEGVFSGDVCIFVAPPPQLVPELMNDLFSWMVKNKNCIHPLILSAVFHYEFVFIHPFSDGNGRMARLWHTALLSEWRDLFEFIPLESQIEKYQTDYYEAISQCHFEGNSDKFIEFMLKMIDTVLDDFSLQITRSNSENSEYVRRLLSVMEYDIPYTAPALMKALGLKSREALRNNYLHPAMELGAIRMTLPDKPKSKNQRYVRV